MKRNLPLALVVLLVLSAALLTACAADEPPSTAAPSPSAQAESAVSWPKDKLALNESGVPTLSVYVVADKTASKQSIEAYLEGVLAGEMKNDWPLEALKAQAILARTYALKFVAEKKSRYDNADISTDIEEAQAYDASAVNDRIRQAVAETRGMVLASDGELPYAWFHAHSGGTTALAKEGLGWEKDEPSYTQVVQSAEPTEGSVELEQAASWKASFPLAEFSAAGSKQGKSVTLSEGSSLSIAQRGESGRAVTLDADGVSLNASSLRIALGSTKMRSTLLTSLKIASGSVEMAGKGYGHGVGMSQWGAYGMAEQGKTAEEIVTHYFHNVKVVKLW